MDNSVCWHAEQLFVLCLKLREKNSWAKGELWPGQCGTWDPTAALGQGAQDQAGFPACLVSGERAAVVRSLAKRSHFDIISIIQRKHIPPENFQ